MAQLRFSLLIWMIVSALATSGLAKTPSVHGNSLHLIDEKRMLMVNVDLNPYKDYVDAADGDAVLGLKQLQHGREE